MDGCYATCKLTCKAYITRWNVRDFVITRTNLSIKYSASKETLVSSSLTRSRESKSEKATLRSRAVQRVAVVELTQEKNLASNLLRVKITNTNGMGK